MAKFNLEEIRDKVFRKKTKKTDKEKKPRQIPESIYLMNHADAPGVLVECGFLSNAEETELLKQSAYQLRLAAAILSGTLSADIT